MFTFYALYRRLNLRGNIGFPPVSQGVPQAQVQRKVAEVARPFATLARG